MLTKLLAALAKLFGPQAASRPDPPCRVSLQFWPDPTLVITTWGHVHGRPVGWQWNYVLTESTVYDQWYMTSKN